MTALAAGRGQITPSKMKRKQFTLLSGQIAYHGGLAAVLLTGTNAGKFVAATGAANELVVGKFTETVNASASGFNADSPVTVEWPEEKTLTPVVNGASTDALAAGNMGQIAYALDDQTATVVPNGSPLGRFWGFDESGRCLIDTYDRGGTATKFGATLAFAANDCVLTAAQVVDGTIFDVPTTAGVSTVTLPVTGVKDGTTVVFIADGTANGHTVQYRFGTTNITAALTASRIHRVVATKRGTIWAANATSAP